MKRIILVSITLFLFLNSFAQKNILPVDSLTGEITFSEVVMVDNVDSKELYNRAKQWVATAFVSAKNVTQMDDKDAGTIIVKAITNVYTTVVVHSGLGSVSYTLTILVKDGRYKYVINDLWHNTDYNVNPGSKIVTPGDLKQEKPGGGLFTMGTKNWNGIKIQAKESLEKLIISLKEAMNQKTKQAENW